MRLRCTLESQTGINRRNWSGGEALIGRPDQVHDYLGCAAPFGDDTGLHTPCATIVALPVRLRKLAAGSPVVRPAEWSRPKLNRPEHK
jgi:hypothetical protein